MISANKAFPVPLLAEYQDSGIWELTHPFVYKNLPIHITVPTKFQSDGASIPKFAYSIIGAPWGGRYTYAAVVHDYGYKVQTRTRKQVDRIFLEGMKIQRVNRFKRWLMYRCVRMAGWIPWRNFGKDLTLCGKTE